MSITQKILGFSALMAFVATVVVAFIGHLSGPRNSIPTMVQKRDAGQPPKYHFYDVLSKRKQIIEKQSLTDETTQEIARVDSNKTHYVVQVGAFSHQTDAEQQLKKVSALGYSGNVYHSGSKYLVRVGAYNDLNSAKSTESKLKQQRFDTLIKKVN